MFPDKVGHPSVHIICSHLLLQAITPHNFKVRQLASAKRKDMVTTHQVNDGPDLNLLKGYCLDAAATHLARDLTVLYSEQSHAVINFYKQQILSTSRSDDLQQVKGET